MPDRTPTGANISAALVSSARLPGLTSRRTSGVCT